MKREIYSTIRTSKHREIWADYAKAIAIFLMVLCHFGLRPEEIQWAIGIFHMPLFFFISGYFDKGKPISCDLIKKNFKQLIVPYLFFSICSFSICWISPYIHPEIYHHGSIPQTFLKALIGMFLMEDQVRPYAFMPTGALWFLVSMFEIRILFSLICYYWKKFKVGIVLIAAFCYLLVYIHFPFFSLDSAALSLPFYVVGFLMKRYSVFDLKMARNINWTLAIICLGFTWLCGMKNGRVGIDSASWGYNVYFFYLNALVGSLGLIFLSKALPENIWILSQIGASTLTILGTHNYFDKIGITLAILAFGGTRSDIPSWYIIVLSCIAVVIGVYIDGILTKYCPKMIGKQNK